MGESAHSGSMSGGPLGRAIPILRVHDLAASVAYYEAALEFQRDWLAGTVASVSRDDASIMLSEGDQGHAGTWVWLSCADVDALYTRAASRGARLRHPPTNYPWGSRECQITDLDDHVLRFGADLRAGEAMGPWRDGKGALWLPTGDGDWERAG